MIGLDERKIIVEEVVRSLQAFYLTFKPMIPQEVRVGMDDLTPINIKGLTHLVGGPDSYLPIASRQLYTDLAPFIKRLYYTDKLPPLDLTLLCFTNDFMIFDQFRDKAFFESDDKVYIGIRETMIVIYNKDYPETIVLQLQEEYKDSLIYGEHMIPTDSKPIEDASEKAFKNKRLFLTALASIPVLLVLGGAAFLIW